MPRTALVARRVATPRPAAEPAAREHDATPDARDVFERAVDASDLRAPLSASQAAALVALLDRLARGEAAWVELLGDCVASRALDDADRAPFPWRVEADGDDDNGSTPGARTRGFDFVVPGARPSRFAFVVEESWTTYRGDRLLHRCTLRTIARWSPGGAVDAALNAAIDLHARAAAAARH